MAGEAERGRGLALAAAPTSATLTMHVILDDAAAPETSAFAGMERLGGP